MTIVDRLSQVLAERVDRRGFLARSAVVGSALTVAPAGYLLRPGTAYAAVCSCVGQGCDCGALCCDGYTEFCCTIYGSNSCPPGTQVAGWWRADGSGFCNGPRYYMDCNSTCGPCGCGSSGVCSGACSGTPCGCGQGNCNERRAGCNEFRYGQCNQAIPCLGPIVCRLVSCIAPWEIEPTCTHADAVDNATHFHDAPCLHAASGAVSLLTASGTQATISGWALDPDIDGPINVKLAIDGIPFATITANLGSPDGVFAHINHGYALAFSIPPGTHQVCAAALNGGPGSVDPLLGCFNVTTGVMHQSAWFLRNTIGAGGADITALFGAPGSVPIVGRWHNDASAPGTFSGGAWVFADSVASTVAPTSAGFGNPNDAPVVGDWNGDHRDGIGVFRNGNWYLRNTPTSGGADITCAFGNPNDVPVVGDWNGDGRDGIGVFRDGNWYLRNTPTSGGADITCAFGSPGDIPVVGDWDGDGRDGIGVYRQGAWFLRNTPTTGPAEVTFGYGDPNDIPLVGRWMAGPTGVSLPSGFPARTQAMIGVAR
jgi:hypothetical protein